MIKQQSGFTLIELMIVIAIIGILAAIAIPAYQDYLVRTQVSEGFSLASGSKTAVGEFYSNNGFFPTSNVEAGHANAGSIIGKYVESVEINRAASGSAHIIATMGRSVNTKVLGGEIILSGTFEGGSYNWSCSTGTGDPAEIPTKYLPSACRTPVTP